MAATCLLYGGLGIDFLEFIFYISSLYRHNFRPYHDKNMAKNCWENFWLHTKPWNSFDEHLSLYRRILEFEQKFLPRKTVENQSLSTKSASWMVIVPWNCISRATVFLESHLGFQRFCNTCDESSSILRWNLEVSKKIKKTVEMHLPFHSFMWKLIFV